MPISVDAYESLAGEILQIYEEAERTMMQRVARRLNRGITQPGWTEKKYGEMKDVSAELRRFMDALSKDRAAMQQQFIEQAYRNSQQAFVNEAYQFGQVLNIQGLTPNTMKVINIMSELNRCMDAADRHILRKANDEYANIVGRASALVATGSITYRDAVQRELNDFANRGITSFVDKAGRSWDMETYAEMATLTAIERATREGYIDTMQEFGYDLAMISDHYGACPICEAWQGVVISVSGDTHGYPTLDEAMAAGVFHPRCLHDISTYYEGITKGGRTAPREVQPPSAGYSARSQQRAYERQERLWKRRMAVAGTPEEERAAYARVRMYQQKIRELIGEYNDETDPSVDHLPRKYWREGGRVKLSDAAKKLPPVKIGPNKPPLDAFYDNGFKGVVNGQDISLTWTRRAGEFKFEIQDVLNAQGFDGMPRILPPDEFDKAVKAANGGEGFIAQRTYSATTQDILDSYRDMLYRGEWYVDCSTGGAQYGQGMYCAADYNGVLSDGIKDEMRHYQQVNVSRGAPFATTETLTLDPSAQIIKHNDLFDLREKFREDFRLKEVDKAIRETLSMADLDKNKDAVIFARFQSGTGDVSWEQASNAYLQLTKDQRDDLSAMLPMIRDSVNKAIVDAEIEYRPLGERYADMGVFAASMGYDAIDAEGHGRSGSYTVILNRTKLIIRGR